MGKFQLCKSASIDDVKDKDRYIWELKYDGERVMAIKRGDKIQLWNRNRKTNEYQFEKSYCYPEVVEDLMIQIHDFVIDGEICCADIHKGLDKFNQRALQTNKLKIELLRNIIPIKFYVFDILECDGVDVRNQKLIIRKTILNNALEETENIEIVPYFFDGKELWKKCLKENWEGIIAKEKNSTYKEGSRSGEWLKIKNVKETIVKILGYKETSGRGSHGALRTDRCDVALTTEQLKREYFEIKPSLARVKYYGVYPSGKLRNPVLVKFEREIK